MATLSPYVGLYADYYFSSDNAALLLPTQFVQGWAARTSASLNYNVVGGAKVLVGGEVGGLGSQNFTVWSLRGPRQRAVLNAVDHRRANRAVRLGRCNAGF